MTGKLTKIGAFEAKTRLSELLRETESGCSFVIHRRGRPVARLVPPADGDIGESLAPLGHDQRIGQLVPPQAGDTKHRLGSRSRNRSARADASSGSTHARASEQSMTHSIRNAGLAR